jgi:alkylhydroperoxidase family enzyme
VARVPYRNREELPEQYHFLYEALIKESGNVGNLYRAAAHSPRLLHQVMRLGTAVRRDTKLDPKLGELAILTVGRLTSATYEYVHHITGGRRVGLSEEQLTGLPTWRNNPAFDEREQAVIRYAEEVTRNVQVPDEVFAAVRGFFDDEVLVELTLTIAFYNMVVRFLEAVQVDLEH